MMTDGKLENDSHLTSPSIAPTVATNIDNVKKLLGTLCFEIIIVTSMHCG